MCSTSPLVVSDTTQNGISTCRMWHVCTLSVSWTQTSNQNDCSHSLDHSIGRMSSASFANFVLTWSTRFHTRQRTNHRICAISSRRQELNSCLSTSSGGRVSQIWQKVLLKGSPKSNKSTTSNTNWTRLANTQISVLMLDIFCEVLQSFCPCYVDVFICSSLFVNICRVPPALIPTRIAWDCWCSNTPAVGFRILRL